MMADDDDTYNGWDHAEEDADFPVPAVTPPPSMHRAAFPGTSDDQAHVRDLEHDHDDDDDEGHPRRGSFDVHASGGGDSRSQGTASTLAPEDVELLSEHLATVKLKAEERVFSLNSQLREVRRKLAASEKKNMEMQHRLYLQSPHLAPHRLAFEDEDDEEEMLAGAANGENNEQAGDQEWAGADANAPATAPSDDPILVAWEQGNRDFGEGDFEGGVRHYTIAARMLAANHAAAETRVSELESELEEINAERELFAARDKDSRAELDNARQELERAEEERDAAVAAARELREKHDAALEDVVRLQNQVEGEQVRAATAVEELEARLGDLRRELDNSYADRHDQVAREVAEARNAALAEVQPEIEDLQARLKAQEARAREDELQRNELAAKAADADSLRAQLDQLETEFNARVSLCDELEARIQRENAEKRDLKVELDALRLELADATSSAKDNNAREQELDDLRQALGDAQKLEQDARAQISLLEDQESDLYARIAELETANEGLEATRAELAKVNEDLEVKFSTKNDQLKQLLRKVKQRKESMEKQTDHITRLEAEQEELVQKLQSAEERAIASEEESGRVRAELEGAREEIRDMKSRAEDLQAQLKAAEADLEQASKDALHDGNGARGQGFGSEEDLASVQADYDRKVGDLQAKLEEARAACLEADVRLNDAESLAKERADELETTRESLERSREAESSLHERISALEDELRNAVQEKDGLEIALEESREEVYGLEDQVAEGLQREASLREAQAASQQGLSPAAQATSRVAGVTDGQLSPPTADLNWDSLVASEPAMEFDPGNSSQGLVPIGSAPTAGSLPLSPVQPASLGDELDAAARSQALADAQQTIVTLEERCQVLETQVQESLASQHELQTDADDARDALEASQAELASVMERLEVERAQNEVLQAQVADAQHAQQQAESLQQSVLSTPAKQPEAQRLEAHGDASGLFDDVHNENDFLLDEQSAVAGDFFGIHHEIDDDGAAAAAEGAAGGPVSPPAASLFEEGVRGGGTNASSPGRPHGLETRVGELEEELRAAQARHADDTKILRERIETLEAETSESKGLVQELEQATTRCETLQCELEMARSEASSGLAKARAEGDDRLLAAQAQIEALEHAIARFEQEIASSQQAAAALRQDLEQAQAQAREAEVTSDQLARVNEELASVQTQRDGLQAEVAQLQADREARRAAETRASDLHTALNAERLRLEDLESDLQTAKRDAEEAARELADARHALDEQAAQASGLEAMRQRLADAEAAVEATQKALEASEERAGSVQLQMDGAQTEIEALQSRLYNLEVEKAEAEKELKDERNASQAALENAEGQARTAKQAALARETQLREALEAAEVAERAAEGERKTLLLQVQQLQEAEAEWAHERRTLATESEEKVFELDAKVAELERELKVAAETRASLESKVQETQELERIRDEIEARDRALVRLSQRATKLFGLVKRLEQERDRAQEDAAAMYDLRISDELEERGGGLRKRSQSPLRSASGSGNARVKEVLGSPGVLQTSSSKNLSLDAAEGDREEPSSMADAPMPPSSASSSSSPGVERGEVANMGEWDEVYDQLDGRLNEYLEQNQQHEAESTAMEEVFGKALQDLQECNSLADAALEKRQAQVDASQEIESLHETLRAAEQEAVGLRARLDSAEQQLEYAQREARERETDSHARVAALEEELARAREWAAIAEATAQPGSVPDAQVEVVALREELALAREQVAAAARQDPLPVGQGEENAALREELSLAREQLAAAKAEARDQEEMNSKLLRAQLQESEGPEGGDAAKLASALTRAELAEAARSEAESRCEAAEAKLAESVREPEILRALSAEISDCVALTAQLKTRPIKVEEGVEGTVEETKSDLTDSRLAEVCRARDDALERVARLEKQLAMRKSIFGAKSGLVGQSNTVEDRPLSPPSADLLPLSASPVPSPNRVPGVEALGFAKPVRVFAALSGRTQQALGGGASLSNGASSAAEDSGAQGRFAPESPLVMPWSEKWWDDDPDDLDLDNDSPGPSASASLEPASAMSGGDLVSGISSPGEPRSGTIPLASPPTASSSLGSLPPSGMQGQMPQGGFSAAGPRLGAPNSVRFGELPPSPGTGEAMNAPPPDHDAQGLPADASVDSSSNAEPETATSANSKKKKVTEPRFLSQMFGLGKHRDLVEASMQDDNSDFDEGETEDTRRASFSSNGAAQGNDMSDPFKAGREIRSRSRTFSNLSSRSVNRAFGHGPGSYPTFEVRQEPTGIIAGPEAEFQFQQQQQQQSEQQQLEPPAASFQQGVPPGSPPLGAGAHFGGAPHVAPVPGRQPGLSDASDGTLFGASQSPGPGPQFQDGVDIFAQSPPTAQSTDALGWSSSAIAEGDRLQQQVQQVQQQEPVSAQLSAPELEWAQMVGGGRGAQSRGNSVVSQPRMSMGGNGGEEMVSSEQVEALRAAKAELEVKLEVLEQELNTEREARMWRERQVCVVEAELEKALVEIEELRVQLSGFTSNPQTASAAETSDVNTPTTAAASPTTAEPPRRRLSVETGAVLPPPGASFPPPLHPAAPPPTSMPLPASGAGSGRADLPPPLVPVQRGQVDGSDVGLAETFAEVSALQAELAQCRTDLERAHAEIHRLQSELQAGAGGRMGEQLSKLREMLQLREQDFDYVTKNLALDVYARSMESPSSIQNGVLGPPSTPRRKAPLHAEKGHATVVYTNSSKVRRMAVWVYNFLLPHVLLVLTTFLISVGTPPGLLKEVLHLASSVPT